MNLEEILMKFALIANLTLEEASPWMPICSDAAEDIKLKLKSGIDIDTNSRRLTTAAAALSFYKYTLYRSSGVGMNSFVAGDIKIENDTNASIKAAFTVWEDAKKSIADLLVDEDFVFRQV